MRREQRKLWLLPWIDERNAIACAMQVLLSAISNKKPSNTPESIENTRQAAQLIDVWHQKSPVDHDKAMLQALQTLMVSTQSYAVTRVLSTAIGLTKRALNNDLTSNVATIADLMSLTMYADGVAEVANDAMAKWRFFDATGRKKMDEELRAAFEAYWLAGEYAAGYAFVGAAWPNEWTLELVDDDDSRLTSNTHRFMMYGLISRTVQ